ncbi:MAG: DUF2723 domain-containing protein [Candidatus Dadabacteria bacterium]|nr:DUF2723 domain-containing protein [Candidatus Dadabacteria bacterium]
MATSKRQRDKTAETAAPSGMRKELPFALAIAAAVFAVYALTAPQTVTFEDDGLFIMASVDAGVAHPPGYPLYTLLGHIFSHLPLGSPALRIHLLSGLLGALACATLFLAARRTGAPRLFAVAAAAAYGVSEHFWSQAIIAEVYTLNALLTFAVLLFCLRAAEKDGKPERELSLAALCFGLGLANHLHLMTLAFPAFAILLLPRWRLVAGGLPRLLAIAFCTAGALYLWMVWRSWQPGLIASYGPVGSLEDFWYYISRQGYGSVDASPSAGLADKAGFAWYFLKECIFLFTPAGALLALAGIRRLYREGRKTLIAATVWIFFAHSLLLILALGIDYDYIRLAIFRPYPLIAYGVMALWMCHGLVYIRDAVVHPLVKTLPALALLIPVFVLHKNLDVNNRSQDRFADTYGRMILGGLEPGAVLFVVGDNDTAPLGYLHHTEGVRPDVELINTQGLIFPNRLFIPTTTTERKKKESFQTFMRGNTRPVYTVTRSKDIPNPGGIAHFGFYRKLNTQKPPGTVTLNGLFDRRVTDYFNSISLSPPPQDRWNRAQHGILMGQYGYFLGYAMLSQDPATKRAVAEKIKSLERHYQGLAAAAEVLIKNAGDTGQLAMARDLLERAEFSVDETLITEMQGRRYYRLGLLAHRQGDSAEARRLFAKSLEVYNHPANPSLDREALKRFRPIPAGN